MFLQRVCNQHMAKLQAVSVPIALGSCAMGQTDEQTDGRITVWLNAPPTAGGIINRLIYCLTD